MKQVSPLTMLFPAIMASPALLRLHDDSSTAIVIARDSGASSRAGVDRMQPWQQSRRPCPFIHLLICCAPPPCIPCLKPVWGPACWHDKDGPCCDACLLGRSNEISSSRLLVKSAGRSGRKSRRHQGVGWRT